MPSNPYGASNGSRGVPEASREPPGGILAAFRRTGDTAQAPKTPQETPKTPQEASRRPREASGTEAQTPKTPQETR